MSYFLIHFYVIDCALSCLHGVWLQHKAFPPLHALLIGVHSTMPSCLCMLVSLVCTAQCLLASACLSHWKLGTGCGRNIYTMQMENSTHRHTALDLLFCWLPRLQRVVKKMLTMLTKPKMVPFLPFLSLFLSYYMRHHLFFIVTHFTKEAGEWCSDLWLSCAIHVVKTDASLLNLIGIKYVLMVDHRLGTGTQIGQNSTKAVCHHQLTKDLQ